MSYSLLILFQLASSDSLYIKRCTELVLQNPSAYPVEPPRQSGAAPSRSLAALRARAEQHCRNLYQLTHRPAPPSP